MGGWLWGGRGVARGLVTMVGAERVTLHTFDVMSVEIVGAKLTVKAETALARMRRWVSEYTLTWTGTLRNLLERLGGGGGISAGGGGGGGGRGQTSTRGGGGPGGLPEGVQSDLCVWHGHGPGGGVRVHAGQSGPAAAAGRSLPDDAGAGSGASLGGADRAEGEAARGGAGGAAAFRRGAGGCGNSGWGELADCRDRGEVSEAARDGADADAAGDDVKRKA